MAQLTAAHLRKWADELEAEEKAELEAAERKRLEEIAARPAVDADDLAFLRRIRADFEKADLEHQAGEREEADEAKPAEKPKPKPDEAEAKPRATRLGRKSGNAYDWTVDDDGRVIRDGVAHIYSGADEPDEVELPDEVGADADAA